jgi:hypothetical protein
MLAWSPLLNRIVDCCLLAELIKLNVYKGAQWVQLNGCISVLWLEPWYPLSNQTVDCREHTIIYSLSFLCHLVPIIVIYTH